jgi:sulfate transport system substrate-binding protein
MPHSDAISMTRHPSPIVRRTLAALALAPAAVTLGAIVLALAGCADRGDAASDSGRATSNARTLTLGAYTTPREVYGRELIPAFAAHWKAETGETVRFQESYLGSGAQARAIAGGFEADVAALSLDPDVETLSRAKLITHDWRAATNAGMVSHSVVVVAVRSGNPKHIRDWDDLARPGIEVLTPNPRTSGGAMWNVAALWGAAFRGATSRAKGDSSAAEQLLGAVLANVRIMDKGARESMITFENGAGDAAITYENEVLASRRAGKAIDYVIPRATLQIENPVAVVDAYAERHHSRELADAFVRFLATPASQRAFAEYGFRPADPSVAREMASRFPEVPGLFTIRDIGGWPALRAALFAPGGAFDRASARAVSAR